MKVSAALATVGEHKEALEQAKKMEEEFVVLMTGQKREAENTHHRDGRDGREGREESEEEEEEEEEEEWVWGIKVCVQCALVLMTGSMGEGWT